MSGPSVSYAAAAAAGSIRVTNVKKGQQERQEERFWECRRSLRLWPVPGATREKLEDYLEKRLGLDKDMLQDAGEVRIRRVIEKKPKYKDEVVVTFEDKAVRDTIKSQAYKLADHREEAGMRLHVPDHLQKAFKALMNLSYDLKKKNNDLKRNIKFDEDTLSMFMDIQTKAGGDWRRVDADRAIKMTAGRRATVVTAIGEDELDEMLGGGTGETGGST